MWPRHGGPRSRRRGARPLGARDSAVELGRNAAAIGSHAREAGLRMSSIALRGKVSLMDRSNHFLLRGVAWYDQSESPVAEPGAADGGSTQCCSALALALPAGVAGAASWA